MSNNKTWFQRDNQFGDSSAHFKWYNTQKVVYHSFSGGVGWSAGTFYSKPKSMPYDSQAQYGSDLWVTDRLERRIFNISLLCEPLDEAVYRVTPITCS